MTWFCLKLILLLHKYCLKSTHTRRFCRGDVSMVAKKLKLLRSIEQVVRMEKLLHKEKQNITNFLIYEAEKFYLVPALYYTDYSQLFESVKTGSKVYQIQYYLIEKDTKTSFLDFISPILITRQEMEKKIQKLRQEFPGKFPTE